MEAGKNRKSPCIICQRVRDPQNCENKLCKDWQAWFIDRWESMRRGVMQAEQGQCIQSEAVSVGGEKYHHPDRVRQFLAEGPCLRCLRSRGLCTKPCQVRRTWENEKEKMRELESGSQGETAKV